MTFKLFTDPTQHKLTKGSRLGYLSSGIHLAPSTVSGVMNTCPFSDGCEASCLYTAGRGAYNSVQKSRIKKTVLLKENPALFREQVTADIAALVRMARRKARGTKRKVRVAVRLNLTSDINYGALYRDIMEANPTISFYDYTKNPHTMRAYLGGAFAPNYHLTFSRGATTPWQWVIEAGGNVAIVFDKLPKTYMGIEVIDGDTNDLRFLDKRGVIVGLTAKGKARKDMGSFIVRNYVAELSAAIGA